ncbi:MAG TPA: inositol monophosphatase family protein, partial [Bryobacteraceae bacterium]|nr:inositol monophosphatase family protein [Bryobacteraceae bacterium]
MSDLTKELEMGRAVARQAGEIALRYYRTGIQADSKPDDSPVTRADRECELAIARALEEAFPDDGLLGEEGAEKPSRSGRRWIIDPIDGTRDFVRGNPAWANLIGLEADGEVVAGFANMPALGELFWAVRGGGAFVNGARIEASAISSVAEAVL